MWNIQDGNDNPWGRGSNPWGGGMGGSSQSPDFEELLRKGQDRFRRFFSNGFKAFLLIILVVISLWLLSGFYRVQPDEQGVVLIFGKWIKTEQPGLHYNFPWPIGDVITPKVTRVNRIDIGYRTLIDRRNDSSIQQDVPDESLMLTGDENIIDIDFTVFWVIKDAGQYLFKIRDPETTAKKAAESAMREVIGRTELQPALTEARQTIESATRELLQRMLDDYQSGIEITQVQLQQSDPPAPVVDAFNDVQRARSDRERLRNEAEAYRNDIIPRARGEAEQLIQEAEAYKEEVVNLAIGDSSRFLSILEVYQANREVTARRMYFETMEHVLGQTEKIIIDTEAIGNQGVLPYLPLDQLRRSQTAP